MCVGIAEKIFKVVLKVKVIIFINSEWYYYSSHSYSPEGATCCIQMCECYSGGSIHVDGVVSRLIVDTLSFYCMIASQVDDCKMCRLRLTWEAVHHAYIHT